jgi:drug/metabolite transporter (DMT)-like permease
MIVKNRKSVCIAEAIAAALLFGASAPVAKLLLGSMAPVPLAAFLYLGSGLGLLIIKGAQRLFNARADAEAGLKREDVKWLAGAVLAGGVAAPIILMISLQNTPGATASLLLNFESVATALIAALAFREAVGRRVWAAVACITLACVILSWDSGGWGFSLGALGIIAACTLWGMDNNFTRSISAKDPVTIVMVKGMGAGLVSLLLSVIVGEPLPALLSALGAMGLGFVFYGLSIVLFILAMRGLGSSRTSAYFGTAPFAGVIISLVLLGETPGVLFLISLPVMAAGALLLVKERHSHAHVHERMVHEHRHNHIDGHHTHTHEGMDPALEHSHVHEHEAMEHSHSHAPDIHHRHGHSH